MCLCNGGGGCGGDGDGIDGSEEGGGVDGSVGNSGVGDGGESIVYYNVGGGGSVAIKVLEVECAGVVGILVLGAFFVVEVAEGVELVAG